MREREGRPEHTPFKHKRLLEREGERKSCRVEAPMVPLPGRSPAAWSSQSELGRGAGRVKCAALRIRGYNILEVNHSCSLLLMDPHIYDDDEGRFVCAPCSQFFSNKSNYQAHLNTKKHTRKCGEGKAFSIFSCSECDSTFNRQFNLRRHMEKSHGPLSLQNYPCVSCSKVFSSSSSLIEHMQSRQPESR